MTTKFIVSTVLGVSAIGGTAGIGYWYSQPKNLKELLASEGVKLLDVDSTKDDDNWKVLAKKYKGTEDKVTLVGNKEVKKIGNFKIEITSSDESKDFEKLKAECKKLFEKSISKGEAFYTAKQNAKDWCASDSEALTKELTTTTRDQASSEPGSSDSSSVSGAPIPGRANSSPSRVDPSGSGIAGGG